MCFTELCNRTRPEPKLHLHLNIAESGTLDETKILIFLLVTDFVKIQQDCPHVCTTVYKKNEKKRAKYVIL